MTTTVEIKGLLERRIELLIKAGLYASKSEVVRDGLRHLLKEINMQEIALQLYQDEEISIGLALELSEMDLQSFVSLCKKRGIKPKLGTEDIDELMGEIKELIGDEG
jgi:putative addiction module CopG family antidote